MEKKETSPKESAPSNVKNSKKPEKNIWKKIAVAIGILVSIAALIFIVLVVIGFYVQNKEDTADVGAAYTNGIDETYLVDSKWGTVPANQLIFMLKDGLTRSDAESVTAKLSAEIIGEIEDIQVYQMKFNSDTLAQLEETLNGLLQQESIEIAIPISQIFSKEIQGKACSFMSAVYEQKGNTKIYDRIGLKKAWDMIHGSGVKLNKVHVGVLDSGLSTKYVDNAENEKGIDVLNKDDTYTDSFHGTDVSNVIGGSWNNGGILGVAGGLKDKLKTTVSNIKKHNSSAGLEIDPTTLELRKDTGHGYNLSNLVQLMQQIKAGAKVINYSQGLKEPSIDNKPYADFYRKFFTKLHKKHPDVIIVAAAGNESKALDGENYGIGGLNLPNIMTVASVDDKGANASFTNTATGNGEISLATVGVDVPTAINSKGVTYRANGTSFSTPQVSAAAAILKSIDPKLTAAEIKNILVSTAATEIIDKDISEDPIPIDQGVGGKIMRLDNAVLKVINDVRKAAGLSELTADELLDRATITATAIPSEDPLAYTINGTIEAVDSLGTNITISVNGDGSVAGKSEQFLDGPGSIKWGFNFFTEENTAQITVSRTDSGACSILNLSPQSTFEGEYQGQGNLPIFFYDIPRSVDFPVTATVDKDGSINFQMSDSGTLPYTISTVSFNVNYNFSGATSGSVDEKGEFTTNGKYSSTSTIDLPAQYYNMLQPEARSYLTGSIDGTVMFSGSIDENGNMKGDMTFEGGGDSTTGTFTTKIK